MWGVSSKTQWVLGIVGSRNSEVGTLISVVTWKLLPTGSETRRAGKKACRGDPNLQARGQGCHSNGYVRQCTVQRVKLSRFRVHFEMVPYPTFVRYRAKVCVFYGICTVQQLQILLQYLHFIKIFSVFWCLECKFWNFSFFLGPSTPASQYIFPKIKLEGWIWSVDLCRQRVELSLNLVFSSSSQKNIINWMINQLTNQIWMIVR